MGGENTLFLQFLLISLIVTIRELSWNDKNDRYALEFRREKGSLIKKFISKNPDMPAPKAKGAFRQGNHLVPKSAGGCPTNSGNLYPDDLLCKTCKGIDHIQGEWQNAVGLERKQGLR